tara:strand:- start:9274 stop:9792 length:519 start_codon:yes stop_codon:yes gene_type:complete
MAVYSDIITNFRAGILEDAKDLHGVKRIAKGIITLGTGDIDDNDIVHVALVPMNAKILSIKLFNDDLDSNGSPALAADVGLYYGGDNGIGVSVGDVIDRDCFATAITDLQSASSGLEVGYEARDFKNNKEVWEDGGLSSNPGGWAYVSVTIETAAATAAAGDLRLDVEYVID